MRGIAVIHVGDDVRHQRTSCTEAIAVDASNIAAASVQEAMQLPDRMVKTSGARPAVRAAENALIAVTPTHAFDFAGHQV